jgi:transcriptional regulator with XRE-family HTH domain
MDTSRSYVQDATASDAVRDYTTIESPTTSYTLRKAAELDDFAKVLKSVTRERLQAFQHRNIEKRAAAKAKPGVPQLLRELTEERGMGWIDIAQLVGVSVSAVRKWRKGGDATAGSRLSLAKLAAILDLLEELAIVDPARWMEIPLPLPSGYTIRPVDLYKLGDLVGILSIASNRRDPEEVLDEIMPEWRDRLRSDFEVAIAPDDLPALQRRSPS